MLFAQQNRIQESCVLLDKSHELQLFADAGAEVAELMSSDQRCCRHVAATFLPCCRRWVRREIDPCSRSAHFQLQRLTNHKKCTFWLHFTKYRQVNSALAAPYEMIPSATHSNVQCAQFYLIQDVTAWAFVIVPNFLGYISDENWQNWMTSG